jgi:alcohol dehydrogenase/propanol-preferring alcohol dehydrogenase
VKVEAALLPLTLGHEIARRVDSLGSEEGSSGFRVGDEVVIYPWIDCGTCRKCSTGKENL